MQKHIQRYSDLDLLSVEEILNSETHYACDRPESIAICIKVLHKPHKILKLLDGLRNILEEYLFWIQLYLARPDLEESKNIIYHKLLTRIQSTEMETHLIQEHQDLFRQNLSLRIQESQDCIAEVWLALLSLDGFKDFYTRIIDRDIAKHAQDDSTIFKSEYLNIDQLMIRKSLVNKVTINIETRNMDGFTTFSFEQIERFKQLDAKENRFKNTKRAEV